MSIYQHLDELKDSDGVGNDAIGLHRQFLNLGWKSHFITRIPRTGTMIEGQKVHSVFDNIKFKTSDIHILHYGGHGYPIKKYLDAPGKKVFRFHNITPSSFYQHTTTPEIYSSMNRFESMSYLEIATIAIGSNAAWCDSPYNAYTLMAFEFQSLNVLPICKKYEINENEEISDNNFNLCFVGRYAPQKKWEDLIVFFSLWIKKYPNAKLFCIGSVIGAFDGYYSRLQNLVNDLDLKEDIHFLKGLSDHEVLDQLHKSAALVSMSEHEGFCLPLLEAFGAGIPVFAFDAGATRSTLNHAGVLFTEKNYPQLVELISEKLTQKEKKAKIISDQFSSLKYYNEFPWKKTLSSLVNQL
jgi:glycosyltransferase involved in cell wall biosynthesis